MEVQRTPTSEPAAPPTRLCSPNPGSMVAVVMVLLVVLLVVMVVVLMVVGESVASKCSL